MLQEILFENLPYGSYFIDRNIKYEYMSEDFKYTKSDFNKLYTNKVRLPDGKGNVIYLMTDTFENSINMINNKYFILPLSYKKIFYPIWYSGKFLNKRMIINTRYLHSERRKMIREMTKLIPYPSKSLTPSVDNIIFFTSDLVTSMINIMKSNSNIKRNYTNFIPSYVSALKSMTPEPTKPVADESWNNRLIIIDCNAFTFNKSASIKDNKYNPLFLLYLAYMRNKELSSMNVDIDMLICNKNLFMKFNPSKITDMKTWGVFRRSLFKMMNIDFDQYTDSLSEDDKKEIEDNGVNNTLSSIIRDTVDMYAKNSSTSTKEILSASVEDKFVKKIKSISDLDRELKLSYNNKVKENENNSNGSLIHTNPVINPLSSKREELFNSISSRYNPLVTKSNITIDDDYLEDEFDDIPEDMDFNEDDIDDIESDVIDLISNDEEIAKELLDDIQDRTAPLKNIETAPVNSERDRKLREEQKKKIVKDCTIEEIINIDSSNIPIEVDDKSNVMHTSNKNMRVISYANFDKTYLEKIYTKDIVSCFNMLMDKSSPFYITGVEIKDSSDALNYIETWTVRLIDENKKKHTITVDLPKFQNHRFMYLNGTRWIIQKQNFYNPLVKDTPDTVIITTNYNKITVQRKSTKSLGIVERIFSLIKKTGDNKMFITGNSSNGNLKYISTLEYDELSRVLFKFKTETCEICFSRDYIKEYFEDKIPSDIKSDEFYIGTENNVPILINEDSGLDRVGRTISDIIEANLPFEYKEIFNSIKGPTQSMYADGKLAGEFIPIITTLVIWIGLTKTLNMMNINWKFISGMRKVPTNTSSMRYIKFADGILEYESKIFAELILNGLYKMKPNKFKFSDFDTEICYDDFIYSQWGSYNGITEIKNFNEFLIDPITKEACRVLMLPDTAPELLIRSVELLADNKFVSKASDQSYRTRCEEQIAGILYAHIANQYKKYIKSGRRIPMSLNQKCVISSLRMLKTVEAYSTLNPVIEVGKTHAISTKGYRGSNSEHSYSDEKKRSYDPTSIGKLAISTSADANVGISKNLVIEPTIANVRGYRKQVENLDELKDINVFSPVEMLTPGSARMDDPIRTAIAVKQSSHVVPVKDASPSLVSNGFDEALQFHLSDDFVINAEEDGEVIDVNNDIGFIMVRYKSGKTKAIYTKPEIVKNSNGGFYMSNILKPVYEKIGDKFIKNEALAYHPKYFKYSKLNGLRYSIGPRIKMAIASSFNTYEDGGISTEELSERMKTSIVYCEVGKFKYNYNIIDMVKVGDHVNIGDSLIKYDISTEDNEISKLLSKLSEENAELLAEETRDDVKASHAGVVTKILVYSLLPPENLSPSLGKIVQEYFDIGINKKEYLEKFDSSDGIMKCGYLLTDTTEPIVNRYNDIKGDKGIDVRIEICIEHDDTMGVGDKVAQYNANKQIVSQVIPKGWEPYSEFRPDEIISSLSSPGTIARRMTPSVIVVMAANKVLIELKRRIKDDIKVKFSRDKIEKIIYDTYDALDPSGSNTNKFNLMFYNMKDNEFEKFIRDVVENENEDFILDIVEFEHSLKYEYCENAAKVLNIPLMEYVYMPHLSMDKKHVVVTKEKCLVGYINIKRTQQLLVKKNGLSLSNDKRSSVTGQVISTSVHKDKNARDSDIEATMLVSLGADKILQELHGPRADDLVMKRQMNQSIATKGYVMLDELDNLATNKVTLNTINTYLLGMMLHSDLIGPTYILPKTSNDIFESADNNSDDIPYAAFM